MKYIVFLLIFFSYINAFAQNNSAEARAAYLLAEEAFENGQFADCASYLDDAAAKLGTANAKILYLKVMSLQAQVSSNPSLRKELLKAAEDFEKAPDIADFNEEKKLEITKLKMKTTKELQSITKQEAAEKVVDSLFKLVVLDDWKLGMSYEEAKQLDPGFFSKANSKTHSYGTVYSRSPLTRNINAVKMKLWMKEEVAAARFRDNRLAQKEKNWLLYTDEKFARTNEIINGIKQKINFAPIVKSTKSTSSHSKWIFNETTETYTWHRGQKFIKLTVTYYYGVWNKKEYEYEALINLVEMNDAQIPKK